MQAPAAVVDVHDRQFKVARLVCRRAMFSQAYPHLPMSGISLEHGMLVSHVARHPSPRFFGLEARAARVLASVAPMSLLLLPPSL